MASDPPRFAQEARLRYLDKLLFWEGRVNRSDLIGRFQISPAQAALDLKSYLEIAPKGSVAYDTRAKRYEAAARFKPAFEVPSAEDWLRHSSEQCPERVDVLPALGRCTDVATLATVHRAIRDDFALQISYQSMTDIVPKVRWIAPRALASDGLRWHARAYCFLHEEYRDFVLTRMVVDAGGNKARGHRPAGDLPDDQEWLSFVEFELCPANSLGKAQAAAIRREYGFKGDTLTVRVRQALVFYAIRRWGLDRSDSRLEIASQRLIQPSSANIR